MNVSKAELRFFKSGTFTGKSNEGLCHIKILPYLSVVQATEGAYEITLGSSEREKVGEGEFFIAPANVKQTIVHRVDPESGKMSARWLFLELRVNGSLPLDRLFSFPLRVKGESAKKLSELFDGYFKAKDLWERYAACYLTVGELMKLAHPRELSQSRGVNAAVDYMCENFDRKLQIEELAKVACTSESNLYASFKKHFGISPISYLNHYRLSIAAEKLSGSELPVKEIAFQVGINDSLYFSKLFKKEYGVSPTEYRLSQTISREISESP